MTRNEIRQLVGHLDSPDSDLQASAETRLAEIGLPAVDALLEATKSSESQVRWRAAYALSKIGDTRAYPHILGLVLNAEVGSEEHYESILALGRLGHARAIEPLIRILRASEPDESQGQWAAAALSELGEPALEALRDVAETGTPDAQELAKDAIDNITGRLTTED